MLPPHLSLQLNKCRLSYSQPEGEDSVSPGDFFYGSHQYPWTYQCHPKMAL